MTWFVTALAIWGTWLNANQKRSGFWLWLMTNMYFSYLNFSIGECAMGCLFSVYALLAVKGLYTWRN